MFGIKFSKTRDRANRTILTITRNTGAYDKATVSIQSEEEWLEEYDIA